MNVIKIKAAIAFLLMVGGVVCFYLLRTSPENKELLTKPFFVPLKIEGFSSGDIPYCNVHIEGQIVKAKIDLGYEGSLALSADVLREVKKKQPLQQRANYGLHGKIHAIICPLR